MTLDPVLMAKWESGLVFVAGIVITVGAAWLLCAWLSDDEPSVVPREAFQGEPQIYGAVHAVRDSHPDHRFALTDEDHRFLASVEQGGADPGLTHSRR